ncbi:YbdK family carboxylate-amine ligase [Glutamicibacter arilaitensis]|uniref:carboxylate-amine ligase n=1 Tax=Glutamicibacter arilaitensis TaxID=256701 RepID=UPI003851455E
MKRTLGIEEEFFLFDARSYQLAPLDSERAEQLLRLNAQVHPGNVQTEFLAAQIEIATAVCVEAGQALDALRATRQLLLTRARELGVFPAAIGTPPALPEDPAQITDASRYAQVQQLVPGLADEHYISGMHIHIGVPDLETGVRALNGLRPWLPVLTALSSNSPFWRGQDTGFSSWRTIQYRRWSINGIPPHFDDVASYQQHKEILLSSESLPDAGHIGWSARLSEKFPTVEIRSSDVQTTSAEAVALAVLMRALVDTVLQRPAPECQGSSELLQLALWQAARSGLQGNLLDPCTGVNAAASIHVRQLLDYVASALRSNDDEELIEQAVEKWLRNGTGAQRQRSAWHTGGSRALLDSALAHFAD